MVLTTLNAKSLVARVTGMRWSMIADGHFTYWNERSLRLLHETVGLEIQGVNFFGVGRDLVSFVDRLGRARRGVARATSDAPGAGRSWDSRRSVLAAEWVANRVLDSTKLGVGILVASRRHEGEAATGGPA